MSIYREQQKAFAILHQILTDSEKEKKNVDINNTIYELTRLYPVSALAIKKQINRFAESRELEIKKEQLIIAE